MWSWRTRVIGGRFLLLALLLYVLLRPLIGLGHQLAVWLVATSVRDLAIMMEVMAPGFRPGVAGGRPAPRRHPG